MTFRHFLMIQAGRLWKVAMIARHSTYRRALVRGVAAGVEHESVPFVQAVTVLDVGANRGQFALIARRRFPRASIYAFEPQPEAARLLREMFAGDATFRLHVLALGSVSAELDLHITAADDSSSLLSPTPRQIQAFPGTNEIGRFPVRVERLDALLSDEITRPSLLKIDVQGAELDVLRGAEHLLAAIDQLYIECSFVELYAGQALVGDVVAYLKDRGFRPAGIFHPTYDDEGHCLQADVLFESEP